MAEGLITNQSAHAVKETLDRFEEIAKSKGFTIFARVDHAAGAAKIGEPLEATELVIFGNPASGTPLMQKARTAAIDLPLKAVCWEENGEVTLAVNDPAWLLARHDVQAPPMVEKMTAAMNGMMSAATSSD